MTRLPSRNELTVETMVFEIDDVIPFSRRHPNEPIRLIIRYDSGYLKDLFNKDDRVCFSEECMKELCRLTKGHKDNWEPPTAKNLGIFASLKPYGTAYLYDFNCGLIVEENKRRLEEYHFD